MSSTEGILKQAISQLIQQIPDIEDLNHLLGESLNIISFYENEETLMKLLLILTEKISNTGGLNHLISVMTNIIEFRKNKKTEIVEDIENLEQFPIGEQLFSQKKLPVVKSKKHVMPLSSLRMEILLMRFLNFK